MSNQNKANEERKKEKVQDPTTYKWGHNVSKWWNPKDIYRLFNMIIKDSDLPPSWQKGSTKEKGLKQNVQIKKGNNPEK